MTVISSAPVFCLSSLYPTHPTFPSPILSTLHQRLADSPKRKIQLEKGALGVGEDHRISGSDRPGTEYLYYCEQSGSQWLYGEYHYACNNV